jgi:signal transduction histidine kinase/ActR/RegA family two-component response regulator
LYLRQVLETQSKQTCEIKLARKDGTHFDAQLESVTVQDESGQFSRCRTIVSDITDRKRSEELALQAARFRSVADLSSGVAHHFNNLLQIVMASASLALTDLESGDGDLSKITTNLEKMLQATRLGAETVRRLQTFANVRTDVTEHDSVVFDIATTARHLAEVSKPFWKTGPEKKGVKIDLQMDLQDGCMVKGQENEMFEVLVNLIKNAAEALPNGGDIEVNVCKEADTVLIQVRDTGIGIAEMDFPRVFQPFWSSKGVGIGKGMGLAVTHGLVKRHNGTISVQSAPGKGTTFTIRLPLARESAAKTEPLPIRTTEDRLTILVIDDELHMATLLERIFAKAGHKVFMVSSGEQGLCVFRTKPVDLVICDLGMPGMSGWDVGTAIRSLCQQKGIPKPPFILLTGWGGQELERVKIRESGTDVVVAKPIDSDALLSTVQEAAIRFK